MLVSMKDMLADARNKHYAIPAFDAALLTGSVYGSLGADALLLIFFFLVNFLFAFTFINLDTGIEL